MKIHLQVTDTELREMGNGESLRDKKEIADAVKTRLSQYGIDLYAGYSTSGRKAFSINHFRDLDIEIEVVHPERKHMKSPD